MIDREPADPPTKTLVFGLLASIGIGVVVFLATLTVWTLAGADHNHYLYPHTYRVLVWLGEVPAVIGVLVVSAWWLAGGTLNARRAGAAAVLSGISVAVLAGAGVWNFRHAGTDPRPENAVPPTISGTASVGETLTVHKGVWTWPDDVASSAGRTFSYRWERCEPAAGRCVEIPHETSTTHVISPGEAGSRLRIAVTVENDAGSRQARSRLTDFVTDS
jgi:hypothetical protein